jgi:hypothetical protein
MAFDADGFESLLNNASDKSDEQLFAELELYLEHPAVLTYQCLLREFWERARHVNPGDDKFGRFHRNKLMGFAEPPRDNRHAYRRRWTSSRTAGRDTQQATLQVRPQPKQCRTLNAARPHQT